MEPAHEWAGTHEEFEDHWCSNLPNLSRRVASILSEFGDVDDVVDEVLDMARARCIRRMAHRSVNWKFILRTTTRVALTKRDQMRRHQELTAQHALELRGEVDSHGQARRLEIQQTVDRALIAVGRHERRVVFEVLRQLRNEKSISYKEMGEALGCSEWKARDVVARCFAKIRAYLAGRRRNRQGGWLG